METVLFVDDEINILNSLQRGLIDEEYECYFATSGKEALQLMRRKPVSVIVTDMRMPEMDGLALLKEVKEKYPKTVRIVLSGYTQLQQILSTINQVDIFKFITKPWKMEEEFKTVIRQAIDYYRLQAEREELKKSLESKNLAYQNILKSIDEVIASAKADMNIAKELGVHTLSYIQSLLECGKELEEVRHEVKLINSIFNDVLSVVEADHKEVNFKDLLTLYADSLKGKEKITKVDLLDKLKMKTGKLKPNLIPLVTDTIEQFFVTEEGKFYIKILCEDKLISNDVGQIEITLLIACLSDTNTAGLRDKNNQVIDDKIQMLNKFLNDILKVYNSSISAARVDINIAIKMQFQYKSLVRPAEC